MVAPVIYAHIFIGEAPSFAPEHLREAVRPTQVNGIASWTLKVEVLVFADDPDELLRTYKQWRRHWHREWRLGQPELVVAVLEAAGAGDALKDAKGVVPQKDTETLLVGLGVAAEAIRVSEAKSVAITDDLNGRLWFAWPPESSATLFSGEKQSLELTREGLFVSSAGGSQKRVVGWSDDTSGEKEMIIESSSDNTTLMAEPELANYLAELAPSLAPVSQVELPWARVAGKVVTKMATAVNAGRTFGVDVLIDEERSEN